MKKINKQTITNALTDFKTHWNKPHDGEYVSYKEFLYFVIGAGASNTAQIAGGNLVFGAGCLFVGAIYGLKMMDFVMLGFVGLVLSYIFNPISMIITDNLGRPPKKTMKFIHLSNIAYVIVGVICFLIPGERFESFMPALPQVVGTKFLVQAAANYWNMFVLRKLSPRFGKYRCWIVASCIPYIISIIAITWFPYNNFSYNDKFWIMHLLFCVMNMFYAWFNQTLSVQNVISPNTNERIKIMSIGSFVYSLLPSIYNIIFPVCAAWAGGMTNIRTYKIVVPIICAVLAPAVMVMGFKVKDKVVQEENHKPQIDMKYGFKMVLKNKYLWISNISSWFSTFAAGAINIVNMLIIYSMRKDYIMGLFSTIIGTAYTPGMLLAPILVKKLGKKRLLLISKYTIVLCSLATVAGIKLHSILIILAATYVSTMLTSLINILSNAMGADIWDYQQYISGERLDGCMNIFSFISGPITTFGALLVPTLYGLVGFTSDWNILYYEPIRDKVFLITIIVGAAVNILATIPFHFYDFTEEKHEAIMEEIRKREGLDEESTDSEETAQTHTEETPATAPENA